ncbi:MAG: VWA domain-containing protein, partial [Myxococcales bacterium]|nr:VWA domain-containing protein [Myxococcales bacterium]
MHRTQSVVLVFLVGLLSACGGAASAQPGSTGPSSWLGGAMGQQRLAVGQYGQTHIGVWVDPPNVAPPVDRGPMALSLVIDTSGSMAGDKIQNARFAAASLIESLQDGDLVSVVTFSNHATEWISPTIVGGATRAMLMNRVQTLQAQGGTNMYGGLTLGEQHLQRAAHSHAVRRLVMISDGHANQGPSDPYSLGQVAAQGSEFGVQVTAIGVGLGYNEHILSELAVQSSGRLYHLAHPAQMASILEQELQMMRQVIATNAWIDIVPGPGVRILGIESLGGQMMGNRARIRLGSLLGGESKEILLRVQVDTSRLGTHPAATATLVYEDPAGRQSRQQNAVLHYEIVN